MSQIQSNALEQEKIYQAKIRNDAIGVASRSDDYTRFKKFTTVDQDAIDEYNAAYHKSGASKSIILGEEPELEELPQARDYGVLTKAETDEFATDIRRKNLLIEDLNQMKSSRDPSKVFEFNDSLVGVQSLFLLKQGLDTDYNLGRVDLGEYLNDRGELDDLQGEIEDEIARLEQEIGSDQALLAQTYERTNEFNAKLLEAKNINKAKVENYRQELELENRGKFTTQQQQPNETEEDYLARLRQIGQTAPAVELDSAQRYALKNFKTKMKELIRDSVKIEQVANSIDLDNKVELLKIWPKIKKSFIDRFGYDNFSLSAEDISKELSLFLTNEEERKTHAVASQLTGDIRRILDVTEQLRNPLVGSEMSMIQQLRSKGIEDSSTMENYHLFKEDNFTLVMWQEGHFGNKIYIMTTINEDDGTKYVLASSTGEEDTYSQVFPKKQSFESFTYESLGSEIGLTAKTFIRLLANSSNASLPISNLFDTLERRFRLETVGWGTMTSKDITNQKGKTEKIVGWGVHSEQIPQHIPFGQIQVLGKKLFYDNILSIRNKSGTATVPNFKSVKVSDKFAKLITSLSQGLDPKSHEAISLIDSLPAGEESLFTELIHIAKLHKMVPRPTSMGSGFGEKKRLELIAGEIHAGNNSPDLIDEAYKCLKRLVSMGEITKPQARKKMQSLL